MSFHYRALYSTLWSWFVKIHARDGYVNTRAVSVIRVTPILSSSRPVRAARSCWHKHVDFQRCDVNSDIVVKILTDLVGMHPALYRLGQNNSNGVRVEPRQLYR